MMQKEHKLQLFFRTLLDAYGPQHWWPGQTPFEVMVGAILTQNTSWTNVERAINNLQKANLLAPAKLHALDAGRLAELIRPAGYFTVKTKRLKNFLAWLMAVCGGDVGQLESWSVHRLREELLSINGIGRETADSIILYALNKPTFVVDTYTYRILVRHGLLDAESDYEMIKEYCESHLPEDVGSYNEFHALLVQVGKNHCKPRPKCDTCPLNCFEYSIESNDY